MTISKLLNDKRVIPLINKKTLVNDDEVLLITKNSKRVLPNSIFIVFKNDYMNSYIDEAISLGATTIIYDDMSLLPMNIGVNYILVTDVFIVYNLLLDIFYENKELPYTIGVTGTSGKTTTTIILYKTLKKANKKVLLIGSNGIYLYTNEVEEYHEVCNTTPSKEIILEYLFKEQIDVAIIEVSSQGIDDKRISGIKFDITCFLNLYPEHLDHHLTMYNYALSKQKLFYSLKEDGCSFVNIDSLYASFFLNNNSKVYTIGRNKGDYSYEIVKSTIDELQIKVNNSLITSRLLGDYNSLNIVFVYAICDFLKIKHTILQEVLLNDFVISGRLEVHKINNRTIILDFAHTENETKAVFEHIQKLKIGRILTVIGCGGERDHHKRSVIGKIASDYSDYVYFTEDNNRSEDGLSIIREMNKDISKSNYDIILVREEAIRKAIYDSKQNDLICLIGKGYEPLRKNNLDTSLNDLTCAKKYLGELYEE